MGNFAKDVTYHVNMGKLEASVDTVWNIHLINPKNISDWVDAEAMYIEHLVRLCNHNLNTK